jgi:uncharacterized membrane protein
MPPILLALSYWLHMVATIVWVGGLAMMALVAWPGARKVLGPGPQLGALFSDWQKRFNPLAWLSLAVLIGTGLTQMTANKNYAGLLTIANPWAGAILAKHIAIAGMIAMGAYMNWSLQPALARLALLEARGKSVPEVETLRRREMVLTRLNLGCAILVLALTAIARALG